MANNQYTIERFLIVIANYINGLEMLWHQPDYFNFILLAHAYAPGLYNKPLSSNSGSSDSGGPSNDITITDFYINAPQTTEVVKMASFTRTSVVLTKNNDDYYSSMTYSGYLLAMK